MRIVDCNRWHSQSAIVHNHSLCVCLCSGTSTRCCCCSTAPSTTMTTMTTMPQRYVLCVGRPIILCAVPEQTDSNCRRPHSLSTTHSNHALTLCLSARALKPSTRTRPTRQPHTHSLSFAPIRAKVFLSVRCVFCDLCFAIVIEQKSTRWAEQFTQVCFFLDVFVVHTSCNGSAGGVERGALRADSVESVAIAVSWARR